MRSHYTLFPASWTRCAPGARPQAAIAFFRRRLALNAVPARSRPLLQIALPKLDLGKFTDSYFKAAEAKKTKKGEAEFFSSADAKKTPLAAQYIANQKALDAALLPALNADLKSYLSTRFTLRDGDRPHLMKF